MLSYGLYLLPILILFFVIYLCMRKGVQPDINESDNEIQSQPTVNLAEFDAEMDKIITNQNLTDEEKQKLANECIERFCMGASQSN